MLERFTDDALDIVTAASKACETEGSPQIRQTHLLLGMLLDSENVAARALEKHGVTYDRIQGVASGLPIATEDLNEEPSEHENLMPFSPGTQRAIELALREALQLGTSQVSAGHLLLGVIRQGEGPGIIALGRLEVDSMSLASLTRSLLTNAAVNEASATDTRLLTAFLYVLMRDHVPLGVVEGIMQDHVEVLERQGIETFRFSNGSLAEYCGQVADRLLA